MATRIFLLDDEHVKSKGIIIDDAVKDTANTPPEQLRAGLALVRVEGAGPNQGKYVTIGHADAPAAGSIVNAVLLQHHVDMRLPDATLVDKQGRGVYHAFVDESQVIMNTADGPTIDAIKAALNLVQFEVPLP
jgi:hypothetical protein